ncbi:hypothetical protein V5799_032227 [Amblyomma americanum]|uniref:Uncharacterized protein n=1 Tax=Amblyomma americanum TaxID=6943 RepID=A0AAQ4DRS2_AMBAM
MTAENFYLVYHSKNSTFHLAFPCLRARRTKLISTTKPKEATYEYAYASGSRVTRYEKPVKLDKTDDAYPYDNEFSINLNHVEAVKLQDFQLIYTDYKHCALFWSWNLGYQVWVEASFLKTQRKVPQLCSILYDLLEPRTKHVVYKWKSCSL